MALTGIPLMMFGVSVGSAKIHDDGTIELTMGSPNAMGKDLITQIEAGLHVGLALTPISVPAPPLTPEDEKALSTEAKAAIKKVLKL